MALTKVTGHVVKPDTNIQFHNTKSTGIVTFTHTSNATSSTTGALQITGGVGIVKDLHVGGNITVGGTLTYDDVTNIDSVGIITTKAGIDIVGGSKKLNFDSGASGVFEVYRESSGNAYIRATNQLRMYSGDRFSFSKIGGIDFLILDTTGNIVTGNTNIIGNIGISSTVPKTDLDVSAKTGAVALPQGTTAQRPTGSAPYIRKNTTNNALEYFDGTSWVEIITDYFPTGCTILG